VLEASVIVREGVIADVYDVDFELGTGDDLAFTGPWTLMDSSGRLYSSERPHEQC